MYLSSLVRVDRRRYCCLAYLNENNLIGKINAFHSNFSTMRPVRGVCASHLSSAHFARHRSMLIMQPLRVSTRCRICRLKSCSHSSGRRLILVVFHGGVESPDDIQLSLLLLLSDAIIMYVVSGFLYNQKVQYVRDILDEMARDNPDSVLSKESNRCWNLEVCVRSCRQR